MSKKKILLGLLVAAGAAYVAYKALKPHVGIVESEPEGDAPVETPEQADAESASVDIEDVIAFVTKPVDAAETAEQVSEQTANVAEDSSESVNATDVVVAAEEDFADGENV